MPPHLGGGSKVPIGGNQVYIDGSAEWIRAQKMYFLHSWNTTERISYFYQKPDDFHPTFAAAFSSAAGQANIKFKP